MKQLVILTHPAAFAGHCTTGGSNKVWAACLAHVREHDTQQIPPQPEMVSYLCAYGRHGAQLHVEWQELTLAQASAFFHKKCQEKRGKGYVPISFASLLPSFGKPLGYPLVLPVSSLETTGTQAVAPAPTVAETTPALRFASAAVKAITLAQMEHLLADQGYGLTEKVNGERCLLAFDGTQLLAYNRKSQPVAALPTGALALTRLGLPFVVDGERLTGEQAGHYVLFDALLWGETTLLMLPYRARLSLLEKGLLRAGLLKQLRLTPTLLTAQDNSTVPDLALLLAVTGAARTQDVLSHVQVAGGEGVVVRKLAGPYDECAWKYKFLADLDAFVLGIHEGTVVGSLRLGLLRPSDGALLEIGNVRSGLTNDDVQSVQTLLARGERPVFRVAYLPARTIGLALVEPRTSREWLRTDKSWQECTTDQLGPEKATLVAQATPTPLMRERSAQ